MKILILADRMQTGGAETHIYELSRSLLSLSHEVVLLSEGGDMAEKSAREGVRHIRIPHIGSPLSLLRIYRVIRAERPTVLHAHTRKTAFFCRILSPFLSAPCVFTAHARFKTSGFGKLTRLFRGKTIAVSEDIALHMTWQFGFPEKEITVIGNGIDTAYFVPAERKTDNKIRILTVSRLDRDCALAATLLLRILPILRQSFNVYLTIVGGGDALPEIQNMAKNVEGVTFAGARSDVRPYVADCDIFVGVSRAALEAMAMEKPVILCGNEGYLGLLDEGNMSLAEETNFCARGHSSPSAEILLHDIAAFFSYPSKEKQRLGHYCRSHVLKYHTAIAMAEKTLGVYRNALRQYNTCDILLCGYYGFGNTGDELVLRALTHGIHTADPTMRIAALMGKGKPPPGIAAARRRSFSLLRTIRRSGAVFLGGGTLLQSMTSRRSLYYYLSLLSLAQRHGKPCGLLLGGIGPIQKEKDRARVAKILQKAAFIGVRDTASVALLAEMGVPPSNIHVGADPVLCLPFPSIADIPQFLTVFPRRGDGQNTALIRALSRLSAKYAMPIRIGVMDAYEDAADADLLAEKLAAKRVSTETPDALCRLICHSRLIVSSRLHALILAYRYGVPAIGLSDDPKLAAFLRDGYSEEAAAMLSLSARPTEQAIFAACRFALLNTERLKTEKNDRISALCRRIRRQFAILVEKTQKQENFH